MSTIPPAARQQPRTVGSTPPRRVMPTQLIILVVALLLVVVVLRACIGGENRYEKSAHDLTQKLQDGDYAGVQKLENVGTAADMGRERFGRASDRMARLGRIKRVKENTPSTDGPRVHEFDVSFDKGTVHEKIEFDPDNKIYHFAYDRPQRTR